jgi:hypothetical protein
MRRFLNLLLAAVTFFTLALTAQVNPTQVTARPKQWRAGAPGSDANRIYRAGGQRLRRLRRD